VGEAQPGIFEKVGVVVGCDPRQLFQISLDFCTLFVLARWLSESGWSDVRSHAAAPPEGSCQHRDHGRSGWRDARPRLHSADDFKPEAAPAWWPQDRYAAWLAGEEIAFDQTFLRAAETEHRTHVRIDPDAGSAADENLFTTAALALSDLPRHGALDFAPTTLAVRVRAADWCGEAVAHLDTLHPLGGERRLARWKTTARPIAWGCPEKMRKALTATSRVRMVLATPAIFAGGWKPGWLSDDLIGAPPGANVRLRLVSASIRRWRAVSGWSLAELPGQPRGPKPVKRMVPAGGVYFFETVDGKALDLAEQWLEPVSDDEQDRRDGFGLATWGVW
jgi:CRISPR-associated protein Cmr3